MTIREQCENLYKTAFGEDKGRTIVLFKEHTDENAGSNGFLRPFQH